MRLNPLLSGVLLLPALLLAGCGADLSTVGISSNVSSPEIAGRNFGGQQPIVGATVYVIAMGTTGYGSPGTILASTTTDGGGNFDFPPGAYTCPQSNTPLYLLGVGGNAGAGTNNNAVTAISLGTCSFAQSIPFLTMNEITTVALAYSLSHFFTTTLGGTNQANADGDWFGGPSTSANGTVVYSAGLELGNSVTFPNLIEYSYGGPHFNITPSPDNGGYGYTVEAAKLFSLANALAACINTNTGSVACTRLFAATTPPGATTEPSDTLQAAVQIALYPYQNIDKIFNVIPNTPAFGGGLTTQPNDWTLAVSYSTTALGLGVDDGTLSTVDIDASNNVWFPSNLSGATGAAYFDQVSETFNGPYNGGAQQHPQQVAIDAQNYVWLNDSASTAVAAYLTSAPSTSQVFSLPNTEYNALTIGGDDSVNIGTTRTGRGGTFSFATIDPARDGLSSEPSITFPLQVVSLAGDLSGGDAVGVSNTGGVLDTYYLSSAPALTPNSTNVAAISGQAVFTGNDYIVARSFWNNAGDGLCVFSLANCYDFGGSNGPLFDGIEGVAIDGAANLWIADSIGIQVIQVPINTPGASGAAVYLDAGQTAVPTWYAYPHYGDGQDNATLTQPFGIAIDNAGDVWVSNANCTGNDCAATGGFVLTEIIGAAAPTITPVSAQITSGTSLVGTKPNY